MDKLKLWLNANKVFLAGLLQFVLVSLNEIFNDPAGNYSTWIIGYSAVIAIFTYLGRNLRGQWASISSTILSSVMVLGGLHNSEAVLTWALISQRILLPLSINILGIFFTSPPKDRGYEKTSVIAEAKAEGKIITEETKKTI